MVKWIWLFSWWGDLKWGEKEYGSTNSTNTGSAWYMPGVVLTLGVRCRGTWTLSLSLKFTAENTRQTGTRPAFNLAGGRGRVRIRKAARGRTCEPRSKGWAGVSWQVERQAWRDPEARGSEFPSGIEREEERQGAAEVRDHTEGPRGLPAAGLRRDVGEGAAAGPTSAAGAPDRRTDKCVRTEVHGF